METYYITLRPSSLNCLFRTVANTIRDVETTDQLLPTRGSFVLMSFRTSSLSYVADIIDKWSLEFQPLVYVEKLAIRVIPEDGNRETIMADAIFNSSFQDKLKLLYRDLSEKISVEIGFPGSFIIYRGQIKPEVFKYVCENFTSFNKGEWLITINKQGSAPLYIKDR